jgi:hypothetical protein
MAASNLGPLFGNQHWIADLPEFLTKGPDEDVRLLAEQQPELAKTRSVSQAWDVSIRTANDCLWREAAIRKLSTSARLPTCDISVICRHFWSAESRSPLP